MAVLLLLFVAMKITSSANMVPININNLGLMYDGLGGLDAVGGARLLFEYPEPTKTQILDLLFTPNYGCNWQILKSEINCDCDSSYGSGSSFLHTRDDTNPNRWNRGTHHWMLQEAMKRNPDIVLYALSWGDPYWVGNGTYLSQDGANYHVEWLLGMIEQYNATYDYIGIWNEMSYTTDYIVELKNTIKNHGLNTFVVAADSKADPILDDMYSNASVRNSVDVVGVHSNGFVGAPPQYLDTMINDYGKKYWNSENNMLDGPYPKWDKYGIPWVRTQIANYVNQNATATILCPFSHSWTFNYGRHNHGHSTFIEPWSGYYELGAPFWTQAHITQFTKPGWYFLAKPGTNNLTNNVYYATYVDIDSDKNVKDFSIVITNEETKGYSFTFELQNGFSIYAQKELQQWKSVEFDWFSKQETITVGSNNQFVVSVPQMSIITVSTITTAQHKVYPIPDRFQFPIPFVGTFDDQELGQPGKRLSDLYGAFDVNIDPTNPDNYVLKQAAPANPGADAWGHRANPLPVTTFPSGTNWANYNISARVLCDNDGDTAMLCGRIPIWEPDGYKLSYALGVCVWLEFGTGKWKLEENTQKGQTRLIEVLSSSAGAVGKWSYMSLGFDDGTVQVIIDDQVSAQYNIESLTGVSGIGNRDYNIAYFDNVTLEVNNKHSMTPNGSYILDCLVGEIVMNSFDGYVGFVLSMTNASESLKVTRLGRFKVTNIRNNNNNNVHEMNVIQVLENGKFQFLLDSTSTIDMKNCVSDLNGFCYTQKMDSAIELKVDGTYFIVSKEAEGGDYFVNMTDPATGTTMKHRDGLTYMSYLAPNKGKIIGRVLFDSETQTANVTQEIDTSYGPVNFVIDF